MLQNCGIIDQVMLHSSYKKRMNKEKVGNGGAANQTNGTAVLQSHPTGDI